jgi:NADP-dependent 3-hydroxy acid dehydrogenase YdfG
VDRVIDVNLKGTIYGSCAAFRAMKQRGCGHIINIISTASLRGIPTESVYCAAKWGVRGFTQALQEEAAPHGIRVTAILPGGVDTSFWKEARKKATPTDTFLQGSHIARVVMQCLEQDPACVVREIIVRSIQDTDFAYGGGE